MIVGVAVILALGFVVGTWLLTRPAGSTSGGGLIITSAPSEAQVLVDGVLVGATPFSSAAIPPGAHDVTLDKNGFATTGDHVKVVSNRVVELHVVLKPKP